MKVAVAGGTGLLGRLVVDRLEATGHQAVVLARSRGVDLTTGRGLGGALDGCGAIVDATNVATTSARRGAAFFGAVTGHLLDAGQRAGVAHLVTVSIVGIDRVGLGYYRAKLHQEAVVAAGPLPWTVLRATQFHEFAAQMFARGRSPVVFVPRIPSRPVAAAEVAERLAELAIGPACAMATPIAGPEVVGLPDLVRGLLRARGSRRLVVPVPMPVGPARAAARGGLLPDGPFQQGVQTYAQHLAALAPVPGAAGRRGRVGA